MVSFWRRLSNDQQDALSGIGFPRLALKLLNVAQTDLTVGQRGSNLMILESDSDSWHECYVC